ncbi:MAG TPA: cytochrome c [Thermoanaerobaculia bacterium]
MRVPPSLNILVLAVGATLLYTWVGQLVPQKEVHPPEVVEIAEDISTQEMVALGQRIFNGKGLCNTCHTIGSSGALRFPDLAGIATRAGERKPGMDALTYLAESLYQPEAYIVPGFNPGMPAIDKPPVALSADEIKLVIAYLQTLGGEATITMASVLPYQEGAEMTSDVDPPGGATAAEATAAAQTAAVTPAGAVGGADGEALVERYGCNECHHDRPGGDGSLAGVGGRLDRAAIQRWLVAHDPPLPASYGQRVTLPDIQAMTDYLAASREAG